MDKANFYLNNMKRVCYVDESQNEDVLLFPENIGIKINKDSMVRTIGLDPKLDSLNRDLLRIIEIEDALELKYRETKVLSPLVYVHSLEDKPWHISTQGFLVTRLSKKNIEWIKKETIKEQYNKHEFDKFWLPFSKNLDEINENDLVCIFNRRVKGWDGSADRPVIELLGAGGHLPSMWNNEKQKFESLEYKENLCKEFNEEIGLGIDKDDIDILGGFSNESSHELVIFCGVYVNDYKLPDIQKYALNNIDEDTDGLYLGTFEETIEYYKINPEPFAGGATAAPYNFPNRTELMKKVRKYYNSK